ncbi:MAG: MopE-related protein [bacterium]
MSSRKQQLCMTLVVSLTCALPACFSDPNLNNNSWSPYDAALDRVDDDHDGFSEAEGDCDDTNPLVNPDAVEVVDGIDNNCDGLVDDDLDNDGFGAAEDCDDNNASIHPLARENCADGVDNNCNGFVDADEPDKDGDGFGPCAGDCNDNNIFISPGNIEDPTDGVDNNCDGVIDEPQVNCDCGAEPGLTIEEQMARAIGLCNEHAILDLSVNGSNPLGYGVFGDWGVITPVTTRDGSGADGWPLENCQFLILASGAAKNLQPQGGMESDLGIYNAQDPAPIPDGQDINDLTQFELRLRVPGNAKGFSFDFIFFSVEYPEFVCSVFNDTFYALVIDEPALNGGARTNISFDQEGNEITVNNGFFEYPPYWSLDITGTAYEHPESYTPGCNDDPSIGCVAPNPCPAYQGSTTGWLRTTSPATPGAEITIIFSIHDEGDNILDSAVIIDNFRWQTVPIDGPGTVK